MIRNYTNSPLNGTELKIASLAPNADVRKTATITAVIKVIKDIAQLGSIIYGQIDDVDPANMAAALPTTAAAVTMLTTVSTENGNFLKSSRNIIGLLAKYHAL